MIECFASLIKKADIFPKFMPVQQFIQIYQQKITMNNRIAYSPQQLRGALKAQSYLNKSPLKLPHHKPQKLTQSYYSNPYSYHQAHNQFSNVKKITQEVADLRHTMNYKVLERLSKQNIHFEEEDKNNKFNDFMRQTITFKSNKPSSNKYFTDTVNSEQAYYKNDTTEESNKYKRLQKYKPSEVKSMSNLLETSKSIREYEKLSEKIDKNKKMIQELRQSKVEQNYLKNVAKKKIPNYIVDLQKEKDSDKIFKKKKEGQQYYFTPKVDKSQYEHRLNSSPLIELSPASSIQIDSINSYSHIVLPKTGGEFSSQTTGGSLKRKTSITLAKSPVKIVELLPIDEYQIGKKLGEGKFGIVNIIRHKKTQGIFALKKIQKSVIKSNMMIEQLALEIRLQSCLHHSNILSMYGFFDDKTHLYIILEYMDGGTLYQKLKKETTISEPEAAYIIMQITQAIEYLHDLGIAHRDIKPQNIVKSNNIYKLCDFGWAAMCNQRRKTYCGTFDYVAPEILQGVDYDMTVDLWCLGVMTYELLTGKAPFYHISRKQTMKKILNVDALQYPKEMSETAKDFIDKLIRRNPQERITAQNALSHPFLKNAEWD